MQDSMTNTQGTVNMGPIIGIDLGTTNSVAAFMKEGQPVVIPNMEGEALTVTPAAWIIIGVTLTCMGAVIAYVLHSESTGQADPFDDRDSGV